MNKKTLVFAATYKEIENIEQFIRNVNSHDPKIDILIIDDNSPDKTYELIEENVCSGGDVNLDNNLDVLDIVLIVNYILGQITLSDEEICIADINEDSTVDVLDVVWGVGIILNN